MGFPINFPNYGKMQRNPWYRESLGNWYSYFSYSMGVFFQLDSHPMAYFIICKMHGFPHQISMVLENATNLIVWGEPGKLVLILFPLDSHFMVYFITWEMHVFSHQFPITREKAAKTIEWEKPRKLVPGNIIQNPLYVENLGNWYSYFSHSMGFFPTRFPWNPWVFSSISLSMGKGRKTHQMGKAWEIGFQENPTKPIVCGESGRLVLILFPEYGASFPLESDPMVYFIICEIYGFPHQFPIAWENAVKPIELVKPVKLAPIFPPTYGYFCSIRFPSYGIFYHIGKHQSWEKYLEQNREIQ